MLTFLLLSRGMDATARVHRRHRQCGGVADGGSAQQPERVRLVGALLNGEIDDAEMQANLAGFREGLRQLSWVEGQNVRFDFRGFAGNPSRLNYYASELVAQSPAVPRSAIIRLSPAADCSLRFGQGVRLASKHLGVRSQRTQ